MEQPTSVKESRKAPNFPWNDELVAKFVDLLVAHQLRYGRQQAFRWTEISDDFTKRIGKACSKEALRNKYENMKKEYKAWKTLKLSETGIGWDPVMGEIDATDQWWERKIKEDVHCKKFRTKGMNPAYEELLIRLFEGQVAIGRMAFSPSMHPSLLAQRYAGKSPIAPHSNNEAGPNCPDLEAAVAETGDEYLRRFAGRMDEGQDEFDPSPRGGPSMSVPIRFSPDPAAVAGHSQPPPIRFSPDPMWREGQSLSLFQVSPDLSPTTGTSRPPFGFSPDPSPGQETHKTCTCGKRRPRQSIGGSKLDDQMAQLQKTAERLVSILHHAFESPKKTYVEPAVSEVVDAMRDLVDNGYIDDHSPEYYFGTSLAADPQFRQVFIAIHDAEHRVGWLRYEISRRALKRKR